ncbi:Subunit of the glycosylphosphatidylinositol transamidase complex-like protein [Elasticomyces elasticus]|nr:Subunit of the glycosylphosphatidylinositol transamidase complex-like protein [Elasticomyces elasticus]
MNYFERLDLTPLPLGSLLASFQFRSNETLAAYEANDYRYFPRALAQVLQHAHVKELHLRFTTGRWDADVWGARPWHGTKEGGTGVELWAWIDGDDQLAKRRWLTLNQGLSGLFCASLNFIDSTRTTQPVLSFEPQGTNVDGYLLHGVLPGKAGISSLLDGHKLFDSAWQSMSIDVQPRGDQIEIHQTIDMVLNIARAKRPRDNPIPRPGPADQLICDETKPYHSPDTCYPIDALETPSWSLSEVFGKTMHGACPLSEQEGPEAKSLCIHAPDSYGVWVNAGGFEVKEAGKRCYQTIPGEAFDFEVSKTSVRTHALELNEEPIIVERTMGGGGMRFVITNPGEMLEMSIFESLPWFLRPFMHTLRGKVVEGDDHFVVKDIFYRPAIDRKRGTQIEVKLSVPGNSIVEVTYDFEKAILRYNEYPPDANRGFLIAPAVIRTEWGYLRTTSLLLSLPTPDFSMPYNVIILTSTVMALAFGSIFNILIRRFVHVDEVPEGKLAFYIKQLKTQMSLLKSRLRSRKEDVASKKND